MINEIAKTESRAGGASGAKILEIWKVLAKRMGNHLSSLQSDYLIFLLRCDPKVGFSKQRYGFCFLFSNL